MSVQVFPLLYQCNVLERSKSAKIWQTNLLRQCARKELKKVNLL